MYKRRKLQIQPKRRVQQNVRINRVLPLILVNNSLNIYCVVQYYIQKSYSYVRIDKVYKLIQHYSKITTGMIRIRLAEKE